MELSKAPLSILLFYFLCLLPRSSLYAQNKTYSYSHIGLENGLSSQLCNNAIEDNLGNIWISTFREINKYNGYNIKTFGSQNSSLTNDYIRDITKDGLGNIWVLQWQEKYSKNTFNETLFSINIINPMNDSISSFEKFFNNSNLILENLNDVYFQEDKILLLTKEGILYAFVESLIEIAQLDSIESFLGPGKNGYYSINNGELNFTEYGKKTIYNIIPHMNNTDLFFQPNKKGQMIIVNTNQASMFPFYFAVDSKIDTVNLENAPETTYQLIYSHVNSIVLDSIGNNSIISTDKVFLNDDKSDLLTQLGITDLHVNSIAKTKTNLLLLSTPKGVYIIDLKLYPFNQLASYKDTINSTRGLIIAKDISCYNEPGKEIITSPSQKYSDFLPKSQNGYWSVSHALTNNETQLWSLGKFPNDKNVRSIDFVSEKTKYYKTAYLRGETTLYFSNSSNSLYVYGNKILKYDPKSDKFENLNTYLRFYNGQEIDCNHIVRDGNQLLLATDKGVVSYNENNDSFNLRLVLEGDHQEVEFIHFDTQNDSIIWLATPGNGLYKWNKFEDSITHFTTMNGLSNNFVHAIHEDESHKLWISTNNNLNCFDKETQFFYQYNTEDGVTHSEFNRDSYYYDNGTGLVYFGGLNGYTYFDPNEISTVNENDIHLRIIKAEKTRNDFSIENIYENVTKQNTIEFNKNDMQVSLELTTNHLLNSDKTRYSYRINSLSDNWLELDNNILKLSKLPYGKFGLELISDLSRRNKTSQILTLEINVPTPLLQKTWFKLLFTLLALTLIQLVIKWRTKNIHKKNVNLELAIKERTKELSEANLSKNKLFTILAHDLRNPLASLSSLTKKIEFLVRKNRIQEINNIAIETESKVNALNDNLNSILDWALLENGTISAEPHNIKLKLEINKLLDLFKSQASDRGIQLINNVADYKTLYLNRTIFQTITRNGLENAIKFCRSDKQVILKLLTGDAKSNVLLIENEYDDLRFMQLSHSSTSVGLKISNELSKIAGIKTELKINDGGTTKFLIYIPT